MQTFLPYPEFDKSAQVLDYQRLGKQRVEAMQIINAIEGKPRKDGKPYKGWLNHPCTVMWRDHVDALKFYCNIMIKEWISRGYNNTMEIYKVPTKIIYPKWLHHSKFHASHRSNLMRKDYEYYSGYGWVDNPEDPYVWRDANKNWYKQYVGTKTREYI
tara:strand:+ start:819 stop:1292 length:474 start_codon:yes stop_codon:yes gene_type:complete